MVDPVRNHDYSLGINLEEMGKLPLALARDGNIPYFWNRFGDHIPGIFILGLLLIDGVLESSIVTPGNKSLPGMFLDIFL